MKQTNSVFSNKIYWFFVILIFLGGIWIRLVDINDLPLDFHPTRQLFSALKARGIYYQDLVDIPEWQKEMAVHQWKTQPTLEPEIIEWLAVISYRQAGSADLALPRIISAIFWVIGGIFLFLAARRLVSPDGALLTASFYLFLPYGVFASRSFQPDPLMVAMLAIYIWALAGWSDERSWFWAILTGVFGGLAILVKVIAVFFVAGGAAVAVLKAEPFRRAWKNVQVWGIALLSLLPTALYYFNGLVLSGATSQNYGGRFFPEMLLSPSFYLRWGLKLDVVIGYLAIAFSLLGLLLFSKKKNGIVLGLWLGYLVNGLIFNYHFSTHDYYQMPFIPVAALSLAPLGEILSRTLRERWERRIIPRAAFAVIWVLALLGAAWTVRSEMRSVDYGPLAETYREVGDILREEGNVVALAKDYGYRLNYWGWLNTSHWPSEGDLWYQEKRGDPQGFAQLFEKHARNRSFFLVMDFDEWEAQSALQGYLLEQYPLFAEGEGYLIFDLR